MDQGSFCQSDNDCETICCFNLKCDIKNNCLNRDLLLANYQNQVCDRDQDCPDSSCCVAKQCLSDDKCFKLFKSPLILGVFLSLPYFGILFLIANYYSKKEIKKRDQVLKQNEEFERVQNAFKDPDFSSKFEHEESKLGKTDKSKVENSEILLEDDADSATQGENSSKLSQNMEGSPHRGSARSPHKNITSNTSEKTKKAQTAKHQTQAKVEQDFSQSLRKLKQNLSKNMPISARNQNNHGQSGYDDQDDGYIPYDEKMLAPKAPSQTSARGQLINFQSSQIDYNDLHDQQKQAKDQSYQFEDFNNMLQAAQPGIQQLAKKGKKGGNKLISKKRGKKNNYSDAFIKNPYQQDVLEEEGKQHNVLDESSTIYGAFNLSSQGFNVKMDNANDLKVNNKAKNSTFVGATQSNKQIFQEKKKQVNQLFQEFKDTENIAHIPISKN
ncbi:UNKNOWN [Stylonychia lemnae]|uniref:Transmembrane protein n=1 Tax=Stylonychia lemnae TaxID=5949 RepID=A0A078A7M1_STYLE|nr:UNKNOWN [Stylonychia lemnae]|eukprot:CDW78239.1 UNKNOWN [Stylonychia lemnae]